MSNNPLVTVVMPAFNASTFIQESIDSVLHQRLKEWELLIIDDCSTDSTANIVRDCQIREKRIKLIQNKQQLGPSRARNRGIKEVKGQYIAFLDSDDLMSKNSLALRLQALQEDKLAIGSYSWQRHIDSSGNQLGPTPRCFQIIRFTDLVTNRFATSMIMLRNNPDGPDLYFDNQLTYGEDWDLWLRLARTGMRFVPASGSVISRRLHSKSLSHSNIYKDFRKRMEVMERAWCEDPRVPNALLAYRGGLKDAMKNEHHLKRAWASMLCAIFFNQFEAALAFWQEIDQQLIAVLPEKILLQEICSWMLFETASRSSEWRLLKATLLKNLRKFSSKWMNNNQPLLDRWILILEQDMILDRKSSTQFSVAKILRKAARRLCSIYPNT